MDQHSHVGAGAQIVTHGLPLCHGRKAAVRNMKKQKKHGLPYPNAKRTSSKQNRVRTYDTITSPPATYPAVPAPPYPRIVLSTGLSLEPPLCLSK
jgi:hypothetical protein